MVLNEAQEDKQNHKRLPEGRGVEGDTGTHQGGQEAKGVKENCGRNFHYGFCGKKCARQGKQA